MKNYYKILEVDREASEEEIKTAYRAFAKKYHPDVNLDNSKSIEVLKDINEAKQILLNPSRKFNYDRLLAERKEAEKFRPIAATRQFPWGRFWKGALMCLVPIALFLMMIDKEDQVVTDIFLSSNTTIDKEEAPAKESGTVREQKKKTTIKRPFTSHISKNISSPIATSETMPQLVEPVIVADKILSQLTLQQMNTIVAEIITSKVVLDNRNNCIKIRKSKNSNITNAFELANILSAKGFIISGREITTKDVLGISVEPANQCTVVTIGRL